MSVRIVTRETICVENVECIEAVSVKADHTPPKRLFYLEVYRNVEQEFGVRDIYGDFTQFPSSRSEIIWFREARSVEDAVALFGAWCEAKERDFWATCKEGDDE